MILQSKLMLCDLGMQLPLLRLIPQTDYAEKKDPFPEKRKVSKVGIMKKDEIIFPEIFDF